MLKSYNLYNDTLEALPDKKLLITTLNAHSYNVARKNAISAAASITLILSPVIPLLKL
jgi:hypothetical protein